MFFDPVTSWIVALLASGIGIADEHEKNQKAEKYLKEKAEREAKKEFFEEPHRDPETGKIVIENNLLYDEDLKNHGAVKTMEWVKVGKYNLSPIELEKEKLRLEEKTLTLYELSNCLSDDQKKRLAELRKSKNDNSAYHELASNNQSQKELVKERIEKQRKERVKRDEELLKKQKEQLHELQLYREHEEYVKSLEKEKEEELLKKSSSPSLNSYEEQRKKNAEKKIPDFDNMEGHQFESFCAKLLVKNGFEKVSVTRGSGDQGIDIIAYREEIKYGFQCKCYSYPIGNHAVQEVFAGKAFYQCHVGVVLTNNYFTSSAKELAKRNGIVLWNRDKLVQLLQNS